MSLYGLRPIIDAMRAGGITTSMIANNAVTYAKIQQVAASRLLGNPTGGVANVSEISLDATLKFSGTTLSIDLAHANTWSGQQTFGTVAPKFSTMTAGSVLFVGSGGLLSQDNSGFFYDSSNKSLILGGTTGIGANNRLLFPASIIGSSSYGLISIGGGFAGGVSHFSGNSNGTYIAINSSTGSADVLRFGFYNGSTTADRILIDSSGSITIGDKAGSPSGVWAQYQGAGGYVFHGSGNGQDIFTGKYGSGNTLGAYVSSGGLSYFGENCFVANAVPAGVAHGFGNITQVASGGVGKFMLFNGTLTASADGDSLYELFLGTTLAAGGKTGLSLFGIWQDKTDHPNRFRSVVQIDNDMKLITAGNGIYIKTGTNATAGTGTLVAGAATINTTKVTANSMVFVSDAGGGVLANIGALYEDGAVRVNLTSFTVKSSNALDTSNFNWLIIEPA